MFLGSFSSLKKEAYISPWIDLEDRIEPVTLGELKHILWIDFTFMVMVGFYIYFRRIMNVNVTM